MSPAMWDRCNLVCICMANAYNRNAQQKQDAMQRFGDWLLFTQNNEYIVWYCFMLMKHELKLHYAEIAAAHLRINIK